MPPSTNAPFRGRSSMPSAASSSRIASPYAPRAARRSAGMTAGSSSVRVTPPPYWSIYLTVKLAEHLERHLVPVDRGAPSRRLVGGHRAQRSVAHGVVFVRVEEQDDERAGGIGVMEHDDPLRRDFGRRPVLPSHLADHRSHALRVDSVERHDPCNCHLVPPGSMSPRAYAFRVAASA